MKTINRLFWLSALGISCFAEVSKPTGCFASTLTERAISNPHMQGGLIRSSWAQLEPSPGNFDFSSIEERLSLLPKEKNWSLAVSAGWVSLGDKADASPRPALQQQKFSRPLPPHMSPPWLVSQYGVETFVISFRGQKVHVPKYWDPAAQKRLAVLMNALAEEYKNDKRLQLVYVPQMTSNGIEGHFNGVPHATLIEATGLRDGDTRNFEKIWTAAALSAIRATALAFDNKAVAFELHELLGSADIPIRIMNEIQADPTLKDQVGIGMWWISGNNDYQSDLIKAFEKFPGDLYGQVIGRSDQTHRFPNGNYGAVFEQAVKLGMRYIEPWNYEFENHTHDDLIADFNRICREKFPEPQQP